MSAKTESTLRVSLRWVSEWSSLLTKWGAGTIVDEPSPIVDQPSPINQPPLCVINHTSHPPPTRGWTPRVKSSIPHTHTSLLPKWWPPGVITHLSETETHSPERDETSINQSIHQSVLNNVGCFSNDWMCCRCTVYLYIFVTFFWGKSAFCGPNNNSYEIRKLVNYFDSKKKKWISKHLLKKKLL